MTDWPYDADQNDPLTKLRIPVIKTPFPDWRYEVALVIDEDSSWGPAIRPNDAEVRQLVSYLEYQMDHYGYGWRNKQAKYPFDVEGMTNTSIFRKRGEGNWCYRKASWKTGVLWVTGREGKPLSLEGALDAMNGYDFGATPSPNWIAFKELHPEIFAPKVSTNG